MKGTFISSDYVFDFDGVSRLIELNTDTSIISSSLNTEHFSCDDFISVLNDNSISKVHIISKPMHKYFVDYLTEQLNASASFITTIENQVENTNSIYPASVTDESDKFILRLAYDESTILDSYYCKNKTRLLTLMADSGDWDYVPTFYATSSYADENLAITSSLINYNDSVPHFVYKASFGNKPVEFCTLVDSGISDEQTWLNAIEEMKEKSVIGNGGHIEKFHYSESDLADGRLASLRSFDIIYTSGSEMTTIPIGRYKVQAIFDVPSTTVSTGSTWTGEALNHYKRLDMKHMFEFGTKHLQNREVGVWEGMDYISGSIGYYYGSILTGSSVESFYVNGVPDTDDIDEYVSWSLEGKVLPSGSYLTSSIIESVENNTSLYKNLVEINLENGETIYGSDNLYILAYDTSSNVTSFQPLFDLTTDDYLHTVSGNLLQVSSSYALISDHDIKITMIDVEAVDNTTISGSDNVIVHNICFAAGTQIQVSGSRQNIEDIVEGDVVATFNHSSNEVEYKRVLKTLVKENESVIKYSFENNTELIATPDHPLYVFGTGYASYDPVRTKTDSGLDVLQIKIGDAIQDFDGHDVIITNIEEQENPITVYNLSEVEGNNNFYAEHLLVHNRVVPTTCFAAGTKITMADGTEKNIEDIVVGDIVRGWNSIEDDLADGEVIKIDHSHTVGSHSDACKLLGDEPSLYTINDTGIEFTPEHPFLTVDETVEGGPFVWKSLVPDSNQEPYKTEQEPLELKVGDSISHDGEWIEIESIKVVRSNALEKVYNFTVKELSSYIADGIIVHNK